MNRADFDIAHPSSGGLTRTGRTILYLVQSASVMQRLIDAGANVNVRDKYGRTPMHLAAEKQRTDVVQSVSSATQRPGGRDDQRVNKCSPADESCLRFRCSYRIYRCLLRHSPALLTTVDDAGNIPLLDAVDTNLLRYGQARDWNSASSSCSSTPCLTCACSLPVILSSLVVSVLVDAGSPLGHANACGDTALHIAARGGRLELARALLAHGADAHQANLDGRVPMHFACENGFKDMLASDPAGHRERRARRRETPGHDCRLIVLFVDVFLFVLVSCLYRLLLSSAVSPPADVNQPDAAGWTSLMYACLGGYPEHESHTPLVAMLLAHGADVHAADCTGLRAVHVCTDTSALRLLLAAGADPTARDCDQRTPLHHLGGDSCVVLLEEFHVPLHALDQYHRTALHVSSDPEKTRLLIAKGADKDALDQEGKVCVRARNTLR